MSRKLKSLSVRYIRGARRVEISTPDEAMLEIAGDNGEGKSSILDAIEWGIRGKRALPVDPLHHGATKGYSRVNLGDLIIERRITEDNAERGGTATISAADGSRWKERDVQQLWGAWTFDPLAFASLSPGKQVAQIRSLAGEEFCAELERLESAIATTREQRTDAGRDVKRFGRIPDLEPVEPVDPSAILDEIQRAQQWNSDQDVLLRQREAHERQLMNVEAQVADLENKLARLTRERDELLEQDLPVVKPFREIAPLQKKLAQCSAINERAQAYRRAEEERAALQAAVDVHAALERDLGDLEEERTQHLRTAQLPVDGLSWEGGAIRLNGTPFTGLSTTEQLVLSARIGMAMSPDLRVMMVRDGGLVDSKRFEVLRDLARESGYQVIMETAGKGHSPDALVIEDGCLDDGPGEDDVARAIDGATVQARGDDWGE